MSSPAPRSFGKFLADIEIVPVFLAIGISIIWPGFMGIALVISAIFWLIRRITLRHFSLKTPGDLGIILLFVMFPVTLWTTTLPEVTETQVLRLLCGIALYYSIINWCNSYVRLRLILPGFAIIGLFLSLIAPISVQWSISKLRIIPETIFQQFPAQFKDVVHPNVLAGSLVIFLPIILGLLMFSWRDLSWFERFLNISSSAAILTVLFLSLSRGSWIALGSVLVLMPILRWSWGWIVIVLAAIAGFVSISLLGLDTFFITLGSSGLIGGMQERFDIWYRALYMIQDFPFTGTGMGSFGQVADAFYPFFLYEPGSIPHAHNLFLQIGVDLGIPGFLGWLWVFGSVIVVSWRLYQFGLTHKERLAAGLGAGFLCSQLALTVHGLTDAVTWGMVRPAPLVWAIWGFAVVSWMIYLKKGEDKDIPIPT